MRHSLPTAGALLTLICAASLAVAEPSHPKEFWRSIVERDFALPEGSSLVDLSAELSGLLASPDPELRDEYAYSILTAWIYQKRVIQPAQLRPLMGRWLANLKEGIGTTDTESVFRWSFSALMLSVVVARDNAAPFLEKSEFHELFVAALEYLGREQDIRGYDPRVGWMHSAAHTADLLKFLGRSRYLDREDQTRLLEAITGKLRAAPMVFAFGEDERLARAILSLVNRNDFDRDAFSSWASRSRPAGTAQPELAQLRANQNLKNLLAKLDVLLSLVPEPSAGIQAAHNAVQAALKDIF